MIYNLVAYLKINLPTIKFVANGWRPESDRDSVMVTETGGTPEHWYERTDWAIQIISRAENVTTSKYQINAVYQLLKNRFGITLSAVTVDLVVYPAVKTYQISPVQSPGYLGTNEENLEMFSFNLTITTK